MFEEYTYYDSSALNRVDVEQIHKVFLRGRVETIRHKGAMCFIILRVKTTTIQLFTLKKLLGADKFTELIKIPLESIVNFYGTLNKTSTEIASASIKHMELQFEHFTVVSFAAPSVILVKDANEFGESFRSDIGLNVRLDNRWIDLRAPVNLAIFQLKSEMISAFREFLISKQFMEINTPKIIGVPSESGADVFKLQYFEQSGCLAQSPQLYKQMAINSDFGRVFEIGPVFRAEKSFTRRHLCEFTGMDIEMEIPPGNDYHEIMNVAWELLTHIFTSVATKCEKSLTLINEKLPFEIPKFTQEPLIIKFNEGVLMLRERGFEQEPFEDLSTATEKALGDIVKEIYGSDLFILKDYPAAVRPFYTMPNVQDGYSNSFDIIFRGQEISSGAQRINDYAQLIEAVTKTGIDPTSLHHYLQSFSNGSPPHGGCGFGLERLCSFYLNLENIRMSSFCPRDPKRITP